MHYKEYVWLIKGITLTACHCKELALVLHSAWIMKIEQINWHVLADQKVGLQQVSNCK